MLYVKPALTVVSLALLACTPCPQVNQLPGGPEDPQLRTPKHQALGDSILGSLKLQCNAVSDHAALELGQYFVNNAVSGALLSHPNVAVADIFDQYQAGPWEWVILTGGGNDMISECKCHSGGSEEGCYAVMDTLADASAETGDMLDLITLIEADESHQAEILLIGYYAFADDAGDDWDQCNPYLDELMGRYQAIAAGDPRVHFLDTREIMDFDTYPERFIQDHIHPSVEGTTAIGEAVAAFIQAQA